MGKHDKKQRRQQRNGRRGNFNYHENEDGDFDCSSMASALCLSDNDEERPVEDEELDEQNEEVGNVDNTLADLPSKFLLYQQSVQSPKGDISYLQKFFLIYVGGRQPLHLQEDFCGTALLSTEWLRSDPRRTAVGLDLDLEALNWCTENNINKIGADISSQISLFHGNVLQPLESKRVTVNQQELPKSVTLEESINASGSDSVESGALVHSTAKYMKDVSLPPRDIVCAFNYSCCCLHKRAELVQYFKNVLRVFSKRGGIFVMDLYGGTSSEQELRLQRRFPNFTYVWEQAEFDIIERKTRISLHFHLQKQQRKIRHAFSYSWRLWSLPEIKDCLEEAGFSSVHFWLQHMPDTEDRRSTVGFGVGRDVKFEEVESFNQQDSWNAYIVGVAK